MGQTRRSYPTVEVAVSTVDLAPLSSGHERILAGDIAGVRLPGKRIGAKEKTDFVWLQLSGLELEEASILDSPLQGHDKRRFCVPLERLKQFHASLDLNRCRDRAEEYQPFLVFDDSDGSVMARSRPMTAQGLVFDRETGRYL